MPKSIELYYRCSECMCGAKNWKSSPRCSTTHTTLLQWNHYQLAQHNTNYEKRMGESVPGKPNFPILNSPSKDEINNAVRFPKAMFDAATSSSSSSTTSNTSSPSSTTTYCRLDLSLFLPRAPKIKQVRGGNLYEYGADSTHNGESHLNPAHLNPAALRVSNMCHGKQAPPLSFYSFWSLISRVTPSKREPLQ